MLDAVKLPVRSAEDLIPARVAASVPEVAVTPPTPAQTEQELVEEEQPQLHDDDDAAPLPDNDSDDDGDELMQSGSSADADGVPYFDDVPMEAYANDEDAALAAPPGALPHAQGMAGIAQEPTSLIALPVQTPQASDFDRPAANFGENLGRVPAEFEDTAEGRFWNAQWGAGRVACYAPDGVFLQEVETPGAPHASCPAFGGPGLSTLYVTSALENMDAEARARHPASGQTFAFPDIARGLPESQVLM